MYVKQYVFLFDSKICQVFFQEIFIHKFLMFGKTLQLVLLIENEKGIISRLELNTYVHMNYQFENFEKRIHKEQVTRTQAEVIQISCIHRYI